MRIPLLPEPGAQRLYGLVTLVNTLGFGLVITSMALYFTRVVHLSTVQVGLGLTISGLIGLIAGVPVGDLADRHGARTVVRLTLLVQFLSTLGYLFIHDFAAFVAVSTIDMLAMNANQAADGALLRRVGGENATVFRSATYAISNVGISLGVVGCAVAVQIGTPNAYRTLIAGNALTFLLAWLISGRLPKYAPLRAPHDNPRWGALTDRAFVAYAAHNALMSMQYVVMLLPLPLWIVSRTTAPRWSVGALLLIAGAITVHTVGELNHASATFALDFGLAPAHAQGQYQGLAGLGIGAGAAAAPVFMIGLCLTFGTVGWAGLGAFFAALGLTAPAIARWAERTRPSTTSQTSGSAHPAPVGA